MKRADRFVSKISELRINGVSTEHWARLTEKERNKLRLKRLAERQKKGKSK